MERKIPKNLKRFKAATEQFEQKIAPIKLRMKETDRIRKKLPIIPGNLKRYESAIRQFEQKTGHFRIQAITRHYSESIAKIIEITEKSEKFDDFYEEFGWLEVISLSYASELENILISEGKEKVWEELNENIIKNVYDDRFLEVNLIRKRKHIISKALEHHINKDYISSIPLLLSQIEGIIWDLGVYKKFVEDKPNSNYKIEDNGNYALDINDEKVKWRLGEILKYMFGKDSKLVEHSEKNVYSRKLRHPILHGRKIDYNDEQTSTSLLWFLITIVYKVKDETN